jgi:ATP synthase protein I
MADDDENKQPNQPEITPPTSSNPFHALGRRLAVARKHQNVEKGSSGLKSSDASAMGQAFRMSAEFVSGVIAGGIIGWMIDKVMDSAPWGIIIFLILGFCAGMMNLMRSAGLIKPSKLRDPKIGD